MESLFSKMQTLVARRASCSFRSFLHFDHAIKSIRTCQRAADTAATKDDRPCKINEISDHSPRANTGPTPAEDTDRARMENEDVHVGNVKIHQFSRYDIPSRIKYLRLSLPHPHLQHLSRTPQIPQSPLIISPDLEQRRELEHSTTNDDGDSHSICREAEREGAGD